MASTQDRLRYLEPEQLDPRAVKVRFRVAPIHNQKIPPCLVQADLYSLAGDPHVRLATIDLDGSRTVQTPCIRDLRIAHGYTSTGYNGSIRYSYTLSAPFMIDDGTVQLPLAAVREHSLVRHILPALPPYPIDAKGYTFQTRMNPQEWLRYQMYVPRFMRLVAHIQKTR